VAHGQEEVIKVMKEQLAKINRPQPKTDKLAVAAAAVEKYVESAEFALQIAQDKKFGKRLFSGMEHGTEAWRRARRGQGLAGAARRLTADEAVHTELRNARRDLQQAYARVDAKRRGHRVITSLARLTSVAGLASLAAVPQVRERVSALLAAAWRNSRHLQDLATPNGLVRNEARPRALEDLTKEKLYARAQEAEIPGRSEMSKEELIDALRAKG
jgi:hypothetical protein